MKYLVRPLEWMLLMLEKVVSAIGGPITAWIDAHPDVKWWARVLRLGLIQFGIGLSLAPISGALNRVLITDLQIPAAAVGLLLALNYFISPVRAMVGYRSDKARSRGIWRTPYVVLGVMLTFAGLVLAPVALILLSGDGALTFWPAMLVCSAIFIAYGAGISILETVYLAIVSDITPKEQRGKVITVLWVMLILGTVVSAVVVSALLQEYSHVRLIQVMQGAAVVFVALTVIALWNQERMAKDGSLISDLDSVRVRLSLWASIRQLGEQQTLKGLFLIIFFATMAFATHDVLLEPYGGQVLNMSVSQTLGLTALWGVMTIVGVGGAGYLLHKRSAPSLLMGLGCAVGLLGFATVSYASAGLSVNIFRLGVSFISIGRGVFLVGSVILVMSLVDMSHAGLFLGLWGIVQAMAQGFGTIGGGIVRDLAQYFFDNVTLGYTMVYMTSLGLLLAVLLILVFRLGQHLSVSEIRMPWDGVEEIPADQLVF